MPCPKCNSNNLWDDHMSWGCNNCSFMSINGAVQNSSSSRDTFNGETSWRAAQPPKKPRYYDEDDN